MLQKAAQPVRASVTASTVQPANTGQPLQLQRGKCLSKGPHTRRVLGKDSRYGSAKPSYKWEGRNSEADRQKGGDTEAQDTNGTCRVSAPRKGIRGRGWSRPRPYLCKTSPQTGLTVGVKLGNLVKPPGLAAGGTKSRNVPGDRWSGEQLVSAASRTTTRKKARQHK